MISAKSPEELIQGRFDSFVQQDFASIYLSYHPDAPLLNFFPECSDYLTYALEEIVPKFEILDCHILRSMVGPLLAEILYRQVVCHNGTCINSLEIGRCRKDTSGLWFFDAALRIDTSLLDCDPLVCQWEDLVVAGNGLWI